MDIGSQIRERRKAKGLTQEELAGLLNVTRSTVSNWEVGRNYPDIQILSRISSVLDIDMNILFDDSNISALASAERCGSSVTGINDSESRVGKSRWAIFAIAFTIVLAAYALFSHHSFVRSSDQVDSVTISGKEMTVSLNLPFYMSADGCMGGTEMLPDGSTADIIKVETRLSFNHKDIITIPAPEKTEIDSIMIVTDDNEPVYSVSYQQALLQK